jgi:hypothetical protein
MLDAVDFAAELAVLAAELERQKRRWAVVGGVALAALGMPRTTLDLDLVLDAVAQDSMVEFLEREGFATLHRSPGYSNHLHPDQRRGRVDLVYVRGETADKLFSGLREVAGPGRAVPVPRPEHLAAMKVLAMKNDPARTYQELADIRFLLLLPQVDRELVRQHFARHGVEGRFDELVQTL